MPKITYSFQEFADTHGGESYLLVDGITHIFADGSTSDGDLRHTEPPQDHGERIRLRHLFFTQKLAYVLMRYRRIRQNVQTQLTYAQNDTGPPPAEGWKESLAELSEAAAECQAQIDKLAPRLPQSRLAGHLAENRHRSQSHALDLSQELARFPTL